MFYFRISYIVKTNAIVIRNLNESSQGALWDKRVDFEFIYLPYKKRKSLVSQEIIRFLGIILKEDLKVMAEFIQNKQFYDFFIEYSRVSQ